MSLLPARRSATSFRTAPKVRSVLPGVRLTLGFTVAYLLFLVIVPLSTLFVRTARLGWSGFFEAATSSRAIAAYKLSVGTSVTAAVVNGVFGLLVAWVLTLPCAAFMAAIAYLIIHVTIEQMMK